MVGQKILQLLGDFVPQTTTGALPLDCSANINLQTSYSFWLPLYLNRRYTPNFLQNRQLSGYQCSTLNLKSSPILDYERWF